MCIFEWVPSLRHDSQDKGQLKAFAQIWSGEFVLQAEQWRYHLQIRQTLTSRALSLGLWSKGVPISKHTWESMDFFQEPHTQSWLQEYKQLMSYWKKLNTRIEWPASGHVPQSNSVWLCREGKVGLQLLSMDSSNKCFTACCKQWALKKEVLMLLSCNTCVCGGSLVDKEADY